MSKQNIGVSNGKLVPCPDTPNCVSTQSDLKSHKVKPLILGGDAKQSLNILREIVAAEKGATIKREDDYYFHAEYRSRFFGFVDDFECLIDVNVKPPIAHFRSASRVGRSDLGVNRKRVERVKEKYRSAME